MEEKKRIRKKVVRKKKKTSKVTVLPTVKNDEKSYDSIAFPAPRDEKPELPELMSLDLKESLELCDSLVILITTAIKILDNGGLDIGDIADVGGLIKDYQKILKGFQGFQYIPDELKGLTKEELMVLAGQLYPVLKALKDLIRTV